MNGQDGEAMEHVESSRLKSFFVIAVSSFALTSSVVAAAAPRIDVIVPDKGVPGTTIVIRGSSFSAQPDFNQVRFAGVNFAVPFPVQPETVNAAGTEMTVVVPPAAVSGTVTVFNGSASSNGRFFAIRRPRVDILMPSSGVPGTRIVIRGVDFSPRADFNQVQFAGANLAVPLPVTPESVNAIGTEMTVVAPRAAGSGQMTVFNGTFRSSGRLFSVDRPRIDALEPNSGVPGTAILIRGAKFSPRADFNQVQFAGANLAVPLPVTPESVNAAGTEMTVVVPHSAGSGQVTVFNGTFLSNGRLFSVAGPRLDAILPNSGVPGTTVLIRGSSFSPLADVNQVQFAGANLVVPLPVTPESVNAAGTEVTVVVPRAAASGQVTVFNGASRSNGLVFSVSQPRIDALVPSGGVPGTTVLIRGANLSPRADFNLVQFAGANLAVPLPVTPESVNAAGTEMTVVVPRAAGSGQVTVSNGTFRSNGRPFSVGQPLITAIVPSSAVPGTRIAIRGQNFSPRVGFNQVQFAGANNAVPFPVAPESVTSAGSEMTVVVPRAAGSGQVTVFNGTFRSNGRLFSIRSGPEIDLLVGSFFGNSVLRYDGSSGAFIDRFVAIGSGGLDVALGIAVGPDHNLYVSSRETDSVLRFDGVTGSFIDVFTEDGHIDNPTDLVFGPDGNLYVSSYLTDAVVRFDGIDGRLIDVFTSGGPLMGPEGLAFGPDGNLYVSSNLNDSILFYDRRTGRLIDALAASDDLDGPTGLSFGPDGNLYVASTWTDSVLRYDTNKGDLIETFVSGGDLFRPIGLRFGPDGDLYVVSQATDRILRYAGASGRFIGVFARGNGRDNWTWFIIRAPKPEEIFADGFESGNTARWSSMGE